jgi:hypothetical protein
LKTNQNPQKPIKTLKNQSKPSKTNQNPQKPIKTRKTNKNCSLAPSTPSKLDDDEQGDYDDGIDFDSTTLTDMPVQNLHSRAPSETVQKEGAQAAHPLTQHPQSFGLQDELARKLKERNQVKT